MSRSIRVDVSQTRTLVKNPKSSRLHHVGFESLESRHLLANHTLLITEFMASNTKTLLDENGNSSDWIEIHNPTEKAVSLNGWSLTDRDDALGKWRFPNATIPAGEYLVVFASGENRIDPAGHLHADFKLGSSGEYLALVDSDIVVSHSYSPAYPSQTNDISYGLDTATDAIGYLLSATPGSMNSPLRGGLVEFSHSSNTFVKPFVLTISTDSAGAEIRYTTNGDTPTGESLRYSEPIEVATTAQIRASAVSPAGALGPVSTASFVQLNGDVQNFTSDLPIVVLENFNGGKIRPNCSFQPQSVSPRFCRATFMAVFEPNDLGRSSLTNEPEVATRAGIKTRGNSSMNWRKSSYALEVWDETNDDQAISILDMPPDADWVFYAPYKDDRSFTRNAFIYELSNQMGRYAPRTRFVEVFTNTDGGPLSAADYQGVYVVMEKIERGPNRVDVADLSPGVTTEPDISGGYIFKIGGTGPGDKGWTTTHNKVRLNYVFPKEQEIPQEQRDFIEGFFDRFEEALGGPTFRDPQLGYQRFFDSDAAIDQHIIQLMTKNTDAFVESTYLHKDRDGKIAFGPFWDFNHAMGVRSPDPMGWTELGVWETQWWGGLFADTDFTQRWIDRYHELRQGILSDANRSKIIDRMVDQLREAAPRNFERWPVSSANAWNSAVRGLKNWLTTRIHWMDSRFLAPPTLTPNDGIWQPDQPITMSGGLGEVYYTTDGSDPRLPGGELSHNAQRYGREETYVQASSAAQYLIPTGNASETNWQAPHFADSSWNSGSAAIGYDSGTSDIGIHTESGFTVRELQATIDVGTLEQAHLILQAGQAVIDTDTEISDVPVINYIDENGSTAHFDQDNSFPNGGGDRTILHATATLIVDTDATYTFGINTDDGSRLRIDGKDVIVDPGRVGSSDQFGTISLAAGSHNLDLLMYDRNGRTQLELFVASGERLSFKEDDFQLLGENTAFRPLFQTDVQPQMKDVNSSLYVRIPFDVSKTADIKRLILSMQYDDGFLAYLNGVEVARRNAAESLGYQSTAAVWRSDQNVVVQEDIDLNDFRSVLREGTNLLAIHGLNEAADNGKFLVVPQLWASLEGEPIMLSGPTTITARVKDDVAIQFGDKDRSPWSPLTTIAFTEAPIADPSNLRITELNYNPHDAFSGEANVNNDAFEFIELMNVGPELIELDGVQLVQGVAFSFTSQLLEPGERVVVVDDVSAFRSRYGDTIRIANGGDGQDGNNGEYGGRLNNGGEAIKLVDRLGRTIQQFHYDDIPPWNSGADGTGNTLEIADALDVANDPYNWNVSAQLGGTPGRDSTLLGDFTNDDTIDANDIDLLFDEMANVTNRGNFDLNQDGLVDAGDVDELVRNILHTQFGDANLDRRVDTDDFMLLAAKFGSTTGVGWGSGDFDGDGVVSFRDFVLLTNRID